MLMIYQQTFKLVEDIEGVLNIPPPRHAFESEKIPERILDNIAHEPADTPSLGTKLPYIGKNSPLQFQEYKFHPRIRSNLMNTHM